MSWLAVKPLLVGGWVMLWLVGGWALRPWPVREVEMPPLPGDSGVDDVPDSYRRQLLSRPAGVVVVVAGVALMDIRAALILGAAAVAVPQIKRRAARRQQEDQIVAELPHVADFFLVALSGGLTVPLAVRVVSERLDGSFAAALADVVLRTRHGARLADELDALPAALGDPTRPLVRVLVAAERYGSSAVDGLEQVARDVRLDRRRRAETAARRLPITLLFPLVLCTLPAFVLLTVVPIIVSSLDGVLR